MEHVVIHFLYAAVALEPELLHQGRNCAQRKVENLGPIHVQILRRPPVAAFGLQGDRRLCAGPTPQPPGRNDQLARPRPSVPSTNGPIDSSAASLPTTRVAAAPSPKM